jgi:hypothetical protein
MSDNNIIPKEIVLDAESGVEIAWFDYYEGIAYCQHESITQSKKDGDSGFIVCCGEVGVQVTPTQFSMIERRII